jgi:bacterial/archaeal transporter family-2 protein
MRTLTLLLMVASGLALGVQVVMNTRVRTALDSPAMGAAVSLAVSVLVLSVVIVFGLLGGTGNAPAGFRAVPPWAWFGGVCGAFYLVAFVIAMPRIGVASTVCATVLGQQVISLCFDTFGWLGAVKVPLTPSRLIGAALLFAGVVLLQRK